jgi:hypothetical protein
LHGHAIFHELGAETTSTTSVHCNQLATEIHGRGFFFASLFLHETSCVLLIDELDKVDNVSKQMLLSCLAAGEVPIAASAG